jgi:hypothetical protein
MKMHKDEELALLEQFIFDSIVVKEVDKNTRVTGFRLMTAEDKQQINIVLAHANFLGKWRSVYIERLCWDKIREKNERNAI